MFVILVYDINVKRVSKVLKLVRRYLVPVQRSVFEGRLTERQLSLLQLALSEVIVPEEDSVVIYTFESLTFSHRLVLGQLDDWPDIL